MIVSAASCYAEYPWRVRLVAQDAALSRRRSGVRIPYALPQFFEPEGCRRRPSSVFRRCLVSEYIPSPIGWVREQVELYERSGGREGTTLRETGLPVIIVTNTGNKTGAIRKTPLMRVKDGDNYVLVGSMGGAPKHPVWVHNLRSNPEVEIRDRTEVQPMRVREVRDDGERARLWALSVAAYPPYEDYQKRTARKIPVFVAEPV
jgi:F420H(2)-dependent quinone reductase